MRPIRLLFSAFLLAMQFVSSVPQPGTIAGRIAIKAMPPQEVASRYPAAGGQVQRTTLPVPTVVYIDGPVAGAPVWSVPSKMVIVQKDLQFSPSLLVAPKNTTVSFPNEDSEFHNVFSYSRSKRFDLGRYPKGESKDVIFDKPGIVKIYCEVHPWMRAVILVLENPFYAIVAADGSFSIRGIPAGHYDMVVWNIDAGTKKLGVNVPSGSTSELQIQLSGESQSTNREPVMRVENLAAKTVSTAGAILEGACCARKR
jgi:plastocyanin